MSAIDIVRANWKARAELQGELRQIDEAATADQREYTEDEAAKITDLRSRLTATDDRIQAGIEMEARATEINNGMDRFLGVLADREGGDSVDNRSMGERFTDTDAFRLFAESNGSGDFRNVRADFPDLSLRAVTNTTLGATSGGALARPALQSRIGTDFPDRRVYLLDLLPHMATTDTAVVYVQDQSPLADLANKAIEVTEATAKPQAGATLAVVTEPIANIAAWVNITRQVAADVPQIQGYLDGRLRYSLKRRADIQLIGGNGTPPNLLGLNGRSGIVTYAPSSDELRYLSIRHAITLMEAAETVPEIIVLNPADAEAFDVSNAATAGLHVVNVLTGPPSNTAWGLTQVHSNAITAGTALLIDPTAVTVYDRQAATAYLTDAHASNFTSNILTLLVESRVGVALYDPKGVALVTFHGAA